jgi:hypothetical protein
MTLQTQRRNEIVDNVVQCRSLNGFKRIHDTHIEGVIWNREFPSTVSSFIDSINIVGATDSRFCSSVDDVAEKAAMTLQTLGLSKSPAQNWLINDIQKLATGIGKILSTSQLQVRIDLVESNACKKFHRDNVKARLICTYRGPGTVYGIAPMGDEPKHYEHVETGYPILLKGKLWSKATDHILLHRSCLTSAPMAQI